jgi:hypothetical protein
MNNCLCRWADRMSRLRDGGGNGDERWSEVLHWRPVVRYERLSLDQWSELRSHAEAGVMGFMHCSKRMKCRKRKGGCQERVRLGSQRDVTLWQVI